MPRPTYAEVDLGAIRANFRALKSHVGPRVKMLAIVKADAYGHGAVPVSRALQEAGADMLGVAMVEEGVELRRAGLALPILVMGPLPADEIPAAMEHDLRPTVNDLATAQEIERQAAACGKVVRVHLKVDTGMNRLGVRAEEAPLAVESVSRMGHLALEGLYTHFACADEEDADASWQQLMRLQAALAGMRSAGRSPPLVHSANSAALLALPDAHFDMVRSGLALYGIRPCPAAAGVDLRPALALHSQVAHLKRVRAGEGVSYGHTWRAPRDSLLGVLPIGYADGYPRALSNRSSVRVAGRLAPVRGTICMDAAMVDLTDIPDAPVGTPVTLLEASHASPLSAAALASLCGTIPYEILTGLARRVPRVYR